MRAWYEFDLLRKFGGVGTDGKLLGFPILTSPVDVFGTDPESVERNTYDECVKRILDDCDSALVYIPEANRDWLGQHSTIDGASRWKRMDGLSVKALKAMVYLYWASPAFNPGGDVSRWENAAKYAAEVMDFKLLRDGAQPNGFNPSLKFDWLWPNSQEIDILFQLDDELKYGESFLSAGIPWQRFRRRDPEPCGRFPDGEWLSY